jgi:hypothetical protein
VVPNQRSVATEVRGIGPPTAAGINELRDLRTTLGTYAHLDVDDMRGALTNLPVVDPPDNAKPAT